VATRHLLPMLTVVYQIQITGRQATVRSVREPAVPAWYN
jgi:hypothetical protein